MTPLTEAQIRAVREDANLLKGRTSKLPALHAVAEATLQALDDREALIKALVSLWEGTEYGSSLTLNEVRAVLARVGVEA